MMTASESDIPASSERELFRRAWRQGTLAFALTVLVGVGLLTLTQSALAQTTEKGHTTKDAPIKQSAPDAANCGPDWVVTSSPNHGTHDNYFNGAVAVSSDDVWAVGYY